MSDESVERRKSDTNQPLQARLQGFFKSFSPVTLRRSLEARLPAAASGPLRRFFQSSKTKSAAVAATQPPKSGLPKDGVEVASSEVMTDTGGAGVSPPPITTVAIRQDKPWRWSENNVPGIVVHEDDIPEEPDSPLNFSPSLPPSHLELSAVTPVPSLRKSPVTVQEWVDSLPHPPPPGSPITGRRQESDLVSNDPELVEVLDTSATDNLVLGAEAGHLSPSRTPSIVVEGPSSLAITPPLSPRLGLITKLEDHVEVPEMVAANAAVINRREQFNRARTTERMASFASDSAASNASSAGVESFLESRKLDPEKILLNLGFGGSQDSNGDLGLSRIPQRFLQPSKVKGISISQFYRHEMNLAETFETGYYGYRGLTGGNLSTCSSPMQSNPYFGIPGRFKPVTKKHRTQSFRRTQVPTLASQQEEMVEQTMKISTTSLPPRLHQVSLV